MKYPTQKAMISSLAIVAALFMVGCDGENVENGQAISSEVQTLEVEMSKTATEHDEDMDADEYENAEELSSFAGTLRRRIVRRFVVRRMHSEFRQNLKQLVVPTFDVDGSGDLSESEAETGRKAVRQCRVDILRFKFDHFDADDSGYLDRDEKKAWIENRRAARAETKAQFDEDGDGVLSLEEKESLTEHIASLIIEELLNKYDANDDGLISDEEVEADDLAACEPLIDLI